MGFANCHPALAAVYFALALGVELGVSHPVYLGVTVLCAAVYSVRLNGWGGVRLCLGLLPCVALFSAWYAAYHHFGVTVLGVNFIGNPITLESLFYAQMLGVRWAGVALWLSCIHRILTADKLVYLLGRVSPRIGLLLTLALRMTPRLKAQAKRLDLARQGVGRGVGQGAPPKRVRALVGECSQLVTWLSEALVAASDSMRARGATRRGRTAYAHYRFDHRDRATVLALTAWATVLAMGLLLGQGSVSYTPALRLNPITAPSLLFYGGYALGVLLPLLLDGWTALCFHRATRRQFSRGN